jgi:predicted RNA-binding protein with RPS1 domain
MSRLAELSVGDVLTGHVSAVVPFGTFVRIADDADGLLPGEDRLEAGASVTVRILEIDTVKHRASLAKV